MSPLNSRVARMIPAGQRLLRAGGFRVEAVTDGKKALAAARRLKPDLVLSDVMMPELDGFGLFTAFRKDAELRDTPVLLLSARAGEEAKVEGLSAGTDDYLIKPFSARELLARVEAVLRRSVDRPREVRGARLGHATIDFDRRSASTRSTARAGGRRPPTPTAVCGPRPHRYGGPRAG